jgi:hypothetical protein
VHSSSHSCHSCPAVAYPSRTSQRHRPQPARAQKRRDLLDGGLPTAETSPRHVPQRKMWPPRRRPPQRFLGVAYLPQCEARRRRRSPSTARICLEPSRGRALPLVVAEAPCPPPQKLHTSTATPQKNHPPPAKTPDPPTTSDSDRRGRRTSSIKYTHIWRRERLKSHQQMRGDSPRERVWRI